MDITFFLILETLLLLCCGILAFIKRKKYKTHLREKEDTKTLYYTVLKSIHAYIILADENFFVKMTNYYTKTNTIYPKDPKRIGELLRCKNGLDANRCGGHDLCNTCPIRAAIQKAFYSNTGFQEMEVSMRLYLSSEKKDYKNVFVTVSGNIVEVDEDRHILLTINDITTRHEMHLKLEEEKLRAEESDRLKTAFLANISHEVRTPLNAITGFSSLLETASTDEERKEYIKIIQTNNDQLLRLMNDIIDLAKLESDTMKFSYSDVNLNQIFYNLKNIFQSTLEIGSNIQFTFKPALNNCYIHTDQEHVSQVLANFLSNAFKFTQKGNITFGYEIQGKEIYCYVQDTGKGISPEDQKRVFDRFTKIKTNKPGTGLGLSLCKMIVDKLQGEIGMTSEPEKGSTFWFTLPVQPLEDYNETLVIQEPEYL